MKSVLEATPPSFSADEVARIAAELFGLDGTVTDLGSERDQTFLSEGSAGSGVLKISNLGERATTLDFEAEAILHILRVDPELPVARPRVVAEAAGAGAYRTTMEGPDGTHFVRLFERLHGRGDVVARRSPGCGRARLRRDPRAAEPRPARLLPSRGGSRAALGPGARG